MNSLLITTNEKIVDDMCRDIVINFIRNGKVVPKEVYSLIESDEPSLLDQIELRPIVDTRETRETREEVGVQCDP